jgi:hypothetical protein
VFALGKIGTDAVDEIGNRDDALSLARQGILDEIDQTDFTQGDLRPGISA